MVNNLNQEENTDGFMSPRHNVYVTDINHGCIKCLADVLRTRPYLQILDLSGIGITDSGLSIISKGLAKNETLVSLSLKENDFGDESMSKIADIIKNTKIEQLDISSNHLFNTQENCEKFLECLTMHQITLKILKMRN